MSRADGPARAESGTRSFGQRALDAIESVGNRLPDPVTIFAGLAVLALIASAIGAAAGLNVAHPVTGEAVAAVNLLSRDGVQRILTGLVDNFTGFAPLGVVLTAMIGIGVAERSGLFAAVLRGLLVIMPPRALTPIVILLGMLSHTAADAGYVILVPLAPMLYAAVGRHPLAGIAAVFAGIGGGFSANLLLSPIDPMLAGITQESARFLDAGYTVVATANYYFMATSVVFLTVIGTLVSVRVVEPRFGEWRSNEPLVAPEALSPGERRGLWAALVSLLVVLALIASMVVPSWGPLRDALTGSLAPFHQSIVGLLLVAFLVPGVAFGIASGRIRSDRDAARMMGETMSTMGSYIVMAFFAGQFIAFFRWSQLGTIVAIEGAALLKSIGLTGPVLLVAFVLVTAAINMCMASASAKWAIMAPVFVPMFMALGWSPETTQAFYRVGDSVTNVVTPLNYYFPIIIAVAQRYAPRIGLGTLISAMLPYSIAFTLAWTALIVAWVLLGLPLGPASPLAYNAG